MNLDEIKAILDKMTNNQHTEADILVLRHALSAGDNPDLQQLGKYITNIREGKEIHIGDRLYQGAEVEEIRTIVRTLIQELQIDNRILGKITLDKNSFFGIIEWIRQTSGVIENLSPTEGKEILDIILKIKVADQSFDFTQFEIQVLDLVFNYSHYYLRGLRLHSPELREQKFKSQQDFYNYAEKMVKMGKKVRKGSMSLSSIIKDDTMSQLIKNLEEW